MRIDPVRVSGTRLAVTAGVTASSPISIAAQTENFSSLLIVVRGQFDAHIEFGGNTVQATNSGPTHSKPYLARTEQTIAIPISATHMSVIRATDATADVPIHFTFVDGA